jgi:hypothetical protein
MTTTRKAILLGAAALVCASVALPVLAQNDDFSGEIRVGYRSVDVGGSETKFREDIDLDDGPRLFELSFDFTPDAEGESGLLVDRVYLDVDNFGGDPFETLSLGVQRFGRFDFRYDRRKSEYFYQDVYLGHPDFHTFDFERVRDSADLDLDLSERATLTFGFDRFTKKGESTTTLDLQRDEFEFDKPVDESMNAYHVGFSYAWDDVTLTVEERFRDYENLYEIFLPGQSPGEDTADTAVLDFYFLDQPYEYTSQEHVVRVVAKPGDWIVRGQALLQSLDLDLDASERGAGTGFTGAPFGIDQTGSGEIDRDLDQFDVDVSYLVNDRWAVIGGAYRRNLDQEGDFLFGGGQNRGTWDIETTGIEAGVEVAATTAVTVTGGVRWENREVEHGALEAGLPGEGIDELDAVETDHTGFFGTLSFRPVGSTFRMTADVDSSSYDDPFTEISPTDRLRWRLRGEYGLGNGFSLAGSYTSHSSENDDTGWDATYDQANLRLAYTTPALSASLGYGLVDVERTIDQTVTTLPGFGGGAVLPLPVIDYDLDTDFIDGRVRWRASPLWVVGGSFRLYDNSGSFGVERDDLRAFVDYLFPAGYTAGLAYRTVDYSEDASSLEDYDADIIELSVGYRW